VKQGTAEDVETVALQRLSNKVKAKLPESQYPAVETAHSSVARLQPDANGSYGF
jgi:hypothetical protein